MKSYSFVCSPHRVTARHNSETGYFFFIGFSYCNLLVWATLERILSIVWASMNYKTTSNAVYFFFSNDAKIINHSWISKSYVLIGYPSKKDEPICQTCESPSSHFTRLDQLHASGNTFINLLVIVSFEIKKHFSICFKYQCNKKSMHMSILLLFCSHCYSNDAMERNR